MLALVFPQIDPVVVQLGPFGIRWYALAYIAGIVLGWRYALRLIRREPVFTTSATLDDFLVWVTLGVVLGGRLGYVLFYKPGYYFSHPWAIPQVWSGGMAFHGGMLGVVIAILLFAHRRAVPLLMLGDVVAAVTPIGLFFGRLANFVNGELWGRVTDVPWAMVFPGGGPSPRHPSQLYQAGMEGLALFLLLLVLERAGARRRPGTIIGAFLLGYGVARSIGELFREPDDFLGFIIGGVTMGQLLSAPMILAGVVFIAIARGRPVARA